MGLMSSMKKGFADTKQEKMINEVNNFDYNKTELEDKIRDTKVNHILHLILSIITAGFWIIIWILVVISAGSERRGLQKQLKSLYENKRTADNMKQTPSANNATNTPNLSDKDKKELKSLIELKELSVLTSSEFEEKKANILSKYN